MSIFNTDNLLTSSLTSHSSSFVGIPNIYDLRNFKETSETINLKIIIYGNKIHKMYLDDIELVYTVDKNKYYISGSLDIYDILFDNGIYDIKKYMFLENEYVNAYFTTDIDSSSSIEIESRDIYCQKIRNKSVFNQIMMEEIILYFNINQSNTTETYLNINLKEYIEAKSNDDSNASVFQIGDYNPFRDKEIMFFDKYYVPIF